MIQLFLQLASNTYVKTVIMLPFFYMDIAHTENRDD